MTSSSADRTATTQPSQTIPAIFNVTVAEDGARLHDPARKPRLIVSSKARLVIGFIGCLFFDCRFGARPPSQRTDT
jgi:hypothetical protein